MARRATTGRRTARWSLLALAAASALAACGGGGGSGDRSAALSDLAQNQAAYAGTTVSTSGTVRRERNADGSRYYVLADPQQDLVVLRPGSRAARYVGRPVSVTGRFGIDPRAGRVIRLRQIAPAPR